MVGADGKPAPRPVKIGSQQGGNWIVLDGLKEGEQVVVDGFQKMMVPGAPVKPVPFNGSQRSRRSCRSRCRQPLNRIQDSFMARFFIDRPIFAWVIALFIMVMGAVAITQLPIAQYPAVAPPSIVVNAAYPGASAQTLEDSVISVIEREMNGSPGLIYMESISQANGTGSITLTFETGTDPALAQVDVQNRLGRATPRLPQAVVQQGVRVDQARSNFLMFTILSSDDPKWDPIALGDYASRTVLPEIQRIPGVGQAQLFGTEKAMRVWIDPAKLVGFNLSPADVNSAIRTAERAGRIGHHRRPAERGRHRHHRDRGRVGPAQHRRTVRQHRPARQPGRLHRAPEGRGPHRNRRPELRAPRRA